MKKINHKYNEKIDESKEFVLQGKVLNVNENFEILNKKISLPKVFKICLSNNSTLTIKDSIVDSKHSSNILKIHGCDNSSGSLLIQNSKFNVDHIELKELSSPNIPLRILYGGMNIIESDFNFNKLNIYSAKSEDGVNFINSNIKGESIFAEGAFSDAIDSDFSKLNINKIICSKIGNDCIDFSYSNANLASLNAKEVGDKAISVGEGSVVKIKFIDVINSSIGIASKDSSKIDINKYNYSLVKIPLVAFIKKQEFGKPEINIFKTNDDISNNRFISYDSNVIISNKKVKGNYTSRKIYDNIYGNSNEIKIIKK